jgi:hypothetical protein
LEGINNKIQLAKRRARGFRNIPNFINMAYFLCGKLVSPSHGGCQYERGTHSSSPRAVLCWFVHSTYSKVYFSSSLTADKRFVTSLPVINRQPSSIYMLQIAKKFPAVCLSFCKNALRASI